MTAIAYPRPRGDGGASYDVRYSDANGQRRKQSFTSPDAADAFAAVVNRAIRRWPLTPLLERCGLSEPADLAWVIGINPSCLPAVIRNGLSDTEADTWATRVGYHPQEIWGWDWIDAGVDFGALDPANPDAIAGGDETDHGRAA